MEVNSLFFYTVLYDIVKALKDIAIFGSNKFIKKVHIPCMKNNSANQF